MQRAETVPLVAIACGGTGGHLFPGLAVAGELQRRGCSIALIISPKEVDQQAVRSIARMQVITLPVVGLTRGNVVGFLRGLWQSHGTAKKIFKTRPPRAVLAMGGFTSAPSILAGRGAGAATFLHESNSIPGRANRWLAPFADKIFVGFPSASKRLRHQEITVSGTPVRPQFQPMDAAACRVTLGLEPQRSTLLVMGGSQGASGINDLLIRSLPLLAEQFPCLQFLHLTGPNDSEKVGAAYASWNCRAVVRPFLTEMELALGAATVAISRAGASSLAEIAALRLPSVLVPYPAAADNHQFFNARAFVETGAARMLVQRDATPELLAEMLRDLMDNPARREAVAAALQRWHKADAAGQIAAKIVSTMERNGVHIPSPVKNEALSKPNFPPGPEPKAQKLQVA